MNPENDLTLYVSPAGDDRWSGKLAEPNAAGDDGPLATLERARDVAREWRAQNPSTNTITVLLRDGRYALTHPIEFGPADSHVTYAAQTGEQAIIDAGQRITGWRIESVHGKACWVADLPAVAEGKWYFRQLWVNGERRQRARAPKQGFYWMEDVPGITFAAKQFDGTDTFKCAPDDIQPWHNLTDVDVVALHYWVEERMPIASFDPATRLVKSSRRSIFALKDDVAKRFARYYVENVFEELSAPGEWYLDRASGKLYYLPMPGETPATAEVFASVIEQWLKVTGDPDAGQFVEGLRFIGLTFQHSEWQQPTGRNILFGDSDDPTLPREPEVAFAAAPQAACNIAGGIVFMGARNCAVEDCAIEHAGGYAVQLADGCQFNRIVGNEMCDLGAGGVTMNGADVQGPASHRTGNNAITDNHIHAGGRVFPSAIGIFSAHAFGNDMSHNHIHDFYYTGISCGWVWGYADSISKDNRIEHNHIHHLGHGALSDMGGIYTLGVQPGTVIRGNHIHDVEKHNYGGWGIYLDEGSAHILVENNICHDTSSQLFHQHYGRENLVRNNIFAFGREGLMALGRGEAHNSFTFTHNILIGDGQWLYAGGYAGQVERRAIRSDLNLLWDVNGKPFISGDAVADANANWYLARSYTWDEWRVHGQDCHSILADPRCRDLAARDFTLAEDSPALALGFKPFVLMAGPRSRDERE